MLSRFRGVSQPGKGIRLLVFNVLAANGAADARIGINTKGSSCRLLLSTLWMTGLRVTANQILVVRLLSDIILWYFRRVQYTWPGLLNLPQCRWHISAPEFQLLLLLEAVRNIKA